MPARARRRNPGPTILDAIRSGDRVRIVDRFGKERTGRAVMRGPHGWVLNMGGPHGTPAVATAENITKVLPRKNPPPIQYEGDDRPSSAPIAHRATYTPAPPGEHVYVSCACGWAADARMTRARARAVFNRHKKAKGARPSSMRRNPPSAWSGHSSVRGGELMSRGVLRVEYEHVDDRPGVARRHDFEPGVFMYALKDGSVLIRHRNYPRTRVWADLPDKGRR